MIERQDIGLVAGLCISQDEAPAAKRLRSSLGRIHDKNRCVANQNQQSISQLVELPEHRVLEECATPMALSAIKDRF